MEHLTFDLSRNEAGEMSPTNMNVATLKLVQALAEKKKKPASTRRLFFGRKRRNPFLEFTLCVVA